MLGGAVFDATIFSFVIDGLGKERVVKRRILGVLDWDEYEAMSGSYG